MTVLVALGLVGGLVLLVAGAEALVRGAVRLAGLLGLSPLVIGLTVVAFGTSAPELAVSVGGAATGAAEIAVGNVVGSNIFNVLAVLGVSALAGALVVRQRIVRIDVPILAVVTVGVWALAADGELGRLDGALLLAVLVAYTVWLHRASRRERDDVVREYAEALPPPQGAAEPAGRGGRVRDPGAGGVPRTRRGALLATVGVVGGLIGLLAGAHLLVHAASTLAEAFGVSDLVVGLTVVAAGTSLPELATSVVAAWRGQRDLAVGNVVGSNLFNLLGVLGTAAVAAPGGVAVGAEVIGWDLPTALVVTLVAPVALATGLVVARWEGGLLVAAYVAYAVVAVLAGVGSPAATSGRVALLALLGALAVAFLVGGILGGRRRPGAASRHR